MAILTWQWVIKQLIRSELTINKELCLFFILRAVGGMNQNTQSPAQQMGGGMVNQMNQMPGNQMAGNQLPGNQMTMNTINVHSPQMNAMNNMNVQSPQMNQMNNMNVQSPMSSMVSMSMNPSTAIPPNQMNVSFLFRSSE